MSADPIQKREIHWVDVRDHLPDDEITVLIQDSGGDIWLGWHDNNAWRNGIRKLPKITHWADLPEPAKHIIP
jgi:hypothetical protein